MKGIRKFEDKNYLLKVIIIIITLVSSYGLYRSEYHIKKDIKSIDEAIEAYLEKEVTIRKVENIDKNLIAFFTIDSSGDIGIVPLYRGINSLFQIRSSSYGSRGPYGFNVSEYEDDYDKYLLIFGENPDLMIDKAIIEYQDAVYDLDVGDDEFYLKMFIRNGYLLGMRKVTLYDKEGNVINDKIEEKFKGGGSYASGTGSLELFMLKVYIAMVIIIGFAIIKLIDNSNREEKLIINKEVTKEE